MSNGNPIGYQNCKVHRVVKDFMIQAGDFLNGDGTGAITSFRDEATGQLLSKFDDENFHLPHNKAGLLSMANSGPNTNGCQFFITCLETPFLNDKHVVFG